MRVLVTGGAGFIGSAVCRRLARMPDCVLLNLDKLTYAANLDSLAGLGECDPKNSFINPKPNRRASLSAQASKAEST